MNGQPSPEVSLSGRLWDTTGTDTSLASMQDVSVRVIRIGTVLMGVSDDVERAWPALERTARERVELRGDAAPCIRFRTDTGVTGMLPMTSDVPIVFGDAEPNEVGRRGTITSADGGSKVPLPLQSPAQVSEEWP